MTFENVAILFTDIVGSTELSQRLSPEAADDVRRGHFSILRQAIAQKGGTEVKNLGDGVMAVFSSASGALGCAVAMQQGVEQDNRKGLHPAVGLRIGLSGGEVVPEDDDYWGDSVIEAARLCALCEGGQILASDVVRLMAGRRSPHQCRSVGALKLKGLPDPVGTVEVLWEPLEAADIGHSVPLPSSVAVRPALGVVGRGTEVGLMMDATKRVASGEGREVLLVSGEAGLGKTTLVAEAARSAFDDGACVLFGHCEEDLATPYQLFAEALGHYVSYANEEELLAHVAEHGSELARLVPALGRRLPGLPPSKATDLETERYLLFAAVVGLLAIASHHQPVVLVLDDLQWADTGSLLLLRHLAGSDAPMRLLALGTYRDSELSNSHALVETLASLHRLGGMSRIELVGLDDAGVMALMEAAAGHALEGDAVGLAHAIYRETDGNPFFVSEVLRNLVEIGAIAQNAKGRWEANAALDVMALPDSVREVIGGRVVRLGEAAGRVLSMAAVIGRDFDLDLLAETTKVDEDELIDLLDEAQRAAVVQELPDAPGRYTFSHALVQHTLYEDLGGTRRTRLHKSVGEAIERLYGENNEDLVGELARHFLLATRPTDSDKAISYAKRAGDAALKALAPDDAVRYFSQALELAAPMSSIDPLIRIDMLIGLGTAQRQAGIASFRETLLEAARGAQELDDTDRLVAAALANNRGLFSALGQVDAEKIDMIEAALEALPDTDSLERARLLATLCSELSYRSPLEHRLALADEAKAMARRLGDQATFIDVMSRCGLAIAVPSTLTSELADFAEALSAARDLDDPVAALNVAGNACSLAVRAGQFELARERLALLRAMAEKLRQPSILWEVGYIEASLALLRGDTEEAEQLASAALEVGTAGGQPDAFAFYGIQLMKTRDDQGRMGELVPLIADAAEQNPTIPTYRAALAAAHLDAGNEETAREMLDVAAADSFFLPDDSAWFDGMVNYARVVIELQLRAHGEPLIKLLIPFRDQVPHDGVIPQPPVAMYLGGLATVVDRFEEAESHFAQAAELNTRGEMKFAEAYTNVLWGRMLRARNGPGDAVSARELLEQARASAAARGYAMVERLANAELSKLS
jgi:class 3 adenylate cyclase